jgi:hypothetical protein
MKETPSQKSKGAWMLSIAAGMIILNFPFIQVFNTGGSFLGLPTLIVYIFLAWSIMISGLIVYSQFFCHNLGQGEEDKEQRKDQR